MKYLALREEVQGHMLDILLSSPQDDYATIAKMMTQLYNVCMKILILAALDKEISILNKLINAMQKDGFCYAKVKNNEIFTALTGVGTLNAFVASYSLLEKIHPDVVINIGTAGGHTLKISDGDIIVCDEAIFHGGYIMSEAPISSWNVIKETELTIKGDENLSKLFDLIKTDVKVHHGKTLSGDFFTKDKEVIKSLRSKYHHLCEDMETIAVYKVCKEKKIPAIAYRIISNNELKGTLYEDNVYKVNEKLQRLIAQLLSYFD